MQLTGEQFSTTAALEGNDLVTFPDYPSEIRAPAGTTYGVSGFQINFAAVDVFTPGDTVDVLVAMNPAALKLNVGDLKTGGLLIVNTDSFTPQGLSKAGYESNPLDDGSLEGFNVLPLAITRNTLSAVQGSQLATREAQRCKNFWTLGLMFWVFSRPLEPTLHWIESKFRKRPDLVGANSAALRAGYAFGDTIEASHHRTIVEPAPNEPGEYRNIGGATALALGLMTGAKQAGLELFLGSYPITPASGILHELSRHKQHGVITVQAEDEIAAVGMAIGASYSGRLGVTTTSGPGLALKGEALGLAVAAELPLVVINVQRGGPSTGLPTKTEQSDLLQAMHGRNGEAPLCVLAARSPAQSFDVAFEAVRIATRFMTPVVVLSDGYLANGAEPWKLPTIGELPQFPVHFPTSPEGFQPFAHDTTTLARPWAIPGTPGLEHRIGGLEKSAKTGHISYDPDNHEHMSHLRRDKIQRIANDIPEQKVEVGSDHGKLLVLGWGSTCGAIREAVQKCRNDGLDVSHAQLVYINPLPRNLEALLRRFDQVLIPELNLGQLVRIIRSEFLIPARSFTKMKGQPFRIAEIEGEIRRLLETDT